LLNCMKHIKDILIALLCGVIFILLLFRFNINMIVSIILTLLTYVALNLIFSNKGKKEAQLYDGFDSDMFHDVLKENRLKIKEVCEHASELKGEVKKKVEKLCNISEQILENVKNNPKNMKSVKKVFTYYLDTTHRILDIYIELSEQDIQSDEIRIRLKKIEDTLDMIINTFEKYLQRSVENELFDLDIEIELLEQTMKMEE